PPGSSRRRGRPAISIMRLSARRLLTVTIYLRTRPEYARLCFERRDTLRGNGTVRSTAIEERSSAVGRGFAFVSTWSQARNMRFASKAVRRRAVAAARVSGNCERRSSFRLASLLKSVSLHIVGDNHA